MSPALREPSPRPKVTRRLRPLDAQQLAPFGDEEPVVGSLGAAGAVPLGDEGLGGLRLRM